MLILLYSPLRGQSLQPLKHLTPVRTTVSLRPYTDPPQPQSRGLLA